MTPDREYTHSSANHSMFPLKDDYAANCFLCFRRWTIPGWRKHCHISSTHPINSLETVQVSCHNHMHHRLMAKYPNIKCKNCSVVSADPFKCADRQKEHRLRGRSHPTYVTLMWQLWCRHKVSLLFSQHITATALKQAVGRYIDKILKCCRVYA